MAQEFELRKVEVIIHADVMEDGELINEVNSQPVAVYPGKIKNIRQTIDNYMDQLRNMSEQQEKAAKAEETAVTNRAQRRARPTRKKPQRRTPPKTS